ncbi:hypothetical protein AJ79_03606 [Helicocarpus griseus UAMH5409]|uniref:Zn(2)-C6 fungal-type domain-containing protein n=1 Tax=Helicocarpus griseus UAMH5409 TaxID=1447875 RepID=A0A2B7XWA3_9EURO|nr:hypothetical protein AJ79_03606 [Helicocarpus griseus UAMH5409]
MAKLPPIADWELQNEDNEDHEGAPSDVRSSRASSLHYSGVNDDNYYDSRRSRACETCRRSKVRCEKPNLNLPCKRCAKARKECIPSSRSNKRHENLDFNDRLMELGGTIEHLISTIRTRTDGGTLETEASVIKSNVTTTVARVERSSLYDDATQELSMEGEGGLPDQLGAPQLLGDTSIFGSQDFTSCVKIKSLPAFIETGISRLISTRTAKAIFDCYCVELVEIFPAVLLGPGTLAAELRASKRILFLAVLAIGSDSICDVDTQKRLRRLLARVLSHCILNKDEYTVELVQSLIVSALWHQPSDSIPGEASMNMPQLCHAAANIAIYIGLDKQSLVRSQNFLQTADIEARRTWLGCYYICANAAMPSQHPGLLCWNQYMDECVETLETSALALPSDKHFCKHVRLQRATDEHSRSMFASHFFQPGATSKSIIADTLSDFERQFAAPDNLAPSRTSNVATQLLYHSSTLYLHEVAATIDCDTDGMNFALEEVQGTDLPQFYATFATDSSSTSSAYIESAHSVISSFTSLDLRAIRALPTIFLVRVIHAITVLVKSSTFQGSDCGLGTKSMQEGNARIDHQLDDLIDVMESWGSNWPACKLIKILVKLRKWRRKNGDRQIIGGMSSSSSRQPEYNFSDDHETELSTAFPPNLQTPTSSQQNQARQVASSLELVDFSAQGATAHDEEILGFWNSLPDFLSQCDKPMQLDTSDVGLWDGQESQPLPTITMDDMQTNSLSVFPDDSGIAWLSTFQ